MFEPDYSKNRMDRPIDHIDNNNFRRGWAACGKVMLEALRKTGVYNLSGYGTTDFPEARNGYFVFIPDDPHGGELPVIMPDSSGERPRDCDGGTTD